MRKLVFALALLTPLSLVAQRAASVSGSVSGTVSCADTNLPAHYASVALEPVRDVGAADAKPAPKSPTPKAPAMITLARTHLNGTFQIVNVRPGRYYVVVQNPGYLSPASEFTQAQIDRPTAELKEAIEKTIPIVTVEPNSNSTIAISLQRAASISGTLRFDDGSAAAGLYLAFERKDKDGKFIPVTLQADGPDDQGHFRASGVPVGEYRLSTTLSVTELQVDGVFGGDHAMMMNNAGGLVIFYGDTFHKKDAKILKIEGGEDLSADITIPSSKIHSLTGALVDARSGHVINAGTVAVAEPDEDDPFTTAKVGADEPSFHFEYIPEGQYTVRVKDARDITREEIPYAPGSFGTRNFKETVLKRYLPYEAPLLVETDQIGLTLPITAAKPGSPAATLPSTEN